MRLRGVVTSDSTLFRPGVSGFLDRLGRGSMTIGIPLGPDGWDDDAREFCRRETVAAVMGAGFGGRGALWLTMGLAEVIREELDREPDP